MRGSALKISILVLGLGFILILNFDTILAQSTPQPKIEDTIPVEIITEISKVTPSHKGVRRIHVHRRKHYSTEAPRQNSNYGNPTEKKTLENSTTTTKTIENHIPNINERRRNVKKATFELRHSLSNTLSSLVNLTANSCKEISLASRDILGMLSNGSITLSDLTNHFPMLLLLQGQDQLVATLKLLVQSGAENIMDTMETYSKVINFLETFNADTVRNNIIPELNDSGSFLRTGSLLFNKGMQSFFDLFRFHF